MSEEQSRAVADLACAGGIDVSQLGTVANDSGVWHSGLFIAVCIIQ